MKIENDLINQRLKTLNDEFIESHLWHDDYLTSGYPWTIIIYNRIVYRTKEIYIVSYNEGTDTFNYMAILTGLFLPLEYKLEFGFSTKAKFLVDKEDIFIDM